MSRSRLSVAELDAIAQGQQERTVLAGTNVQYISKCRVLTKILNEFSDDIRNEALELDEDGIARRRTEIRWLVEQSRS